MPASEDKDTGKLRTAMEDEAPARRSPQSCTPCSLPEPTWSAALRSRMLRRSRVRAPLFSARPGRSPFKSYYCSYYVLERK